MRIASWTASVCPGPTSASQETDAIRRNRYPPISRCCAATAVCPRQTGASGSRLQISGRHSSYEKPSVNRTAFCWTRSIRLIGDVRLAWCRASMGWVRSFQDDDTPPRVRERADST